MRAGAVQAGIEEEKMLLGGDIILKVGGIAFGAKFAGLEDIRDYPDCPVGSVSHGACPG